MKTLAPSWPSRSAIACPIPAVAAVTTATLPSSLRHDMPTASPIALRVQSAELSWKVWEMRGTRHARQAESEARSFAASGKSVYPYPNPSYATQAQF